MGGDSQGIGSLKQLIDAISACDRCELAKYRVKLVPGYGPPNAKIFVVGEAPGLEAESQRKPFVGMYEPVIAGWLDYLELRRKAKPKAIHGASRRTLLRMTVAAMAVNIGGG